MDRERLLLSRWNLLLPHCQALGTDLVRRYADPARHYHGLDHLLAVLERVDSLSGEAAQPRLVTLGAWYHDAVYDVRRDDNEERSAELALHTLRESGLDIADVSEVARLVRLTASHDPRSGDSNGAVLSDSDLAVLAGDHAAYSSYVSAVRAEYAHLGDAEFRRGRAAVVEHLVALPALFRTCRGATVWEARARNNLSTELARLRAEITRSP